MSSVNDGSSVGMMDPAYFVGKKILLEWINDLLKLDVKKIEDTCSGAVACQIVHSLFPNDVPMSKVDFGAKYDYDYVKNYKVLQNAFAKLKVSKIVPVDKLVRGKYQDNLEFMQWLKSFYDLNGAVKDGYDPVEARARAKNVPKANLDAPAFTPSSPSHAAAGGGSAVKRAPAPAAAAAERKPIAETTKENKTAPATTTTKETKATPATTSRGAATTTKTGSSTAASGRAASAGAGAPASRAPRTGSAGAGGGAGAAGGKLQEANEKLVHEVATLKLELGALQSSSSSADKQASAGGGDETAVKLALDGLEKERDFYFKKLRDIEVYLQELGEPEEMESELAKTITQKVFAVLYATDDEDFEAPPSATETPDKASGIASRLPSAVTSASH